MADKQKDIVVGRVKTDKGKRWRVFGVHGKERVLVEGAAGDSRWDTIEEWIEQIEEVHGGEVTAESHLVTYYGKTLSDGTHLTPKGTPFSLGVFNDKLKEFMAGGDPDA